jgi:hypothetical protein
MAVRYEKTDVQSAKVVRAGVGLLAVVAVFFALMWMLQGVLLRFEQNAQVPPHPLASTLARSEPPLPRLQPNPRADLLALRAEEDAVLKTYAWVDKGRGIVRVPIERAIEILAQRGLPARAAAAGEAR